MSRSWGREWRKTTYNRRLVQDLVDHVICTAQVEQRVYVKLTKAIYILPMPHRGCNGGGKISGENGRAN